MLICYRTEGQVNVEPGSNPTDKIRVLQRCNKSTMRLLEGYYSHRVARGALCMWDLLATPGYKGTSRLHIFLCWYASEALMLLVGVMSACASVVLRAGRDPTADRALHGREGDGVDRIVNDLKFQGD